MPEPRSPLESLLAPGRFGAHAPCPASIVTPDYYSFGANPLAPKALGFTGWSELARKPACGVQRSFYNKPVEERYGAQIVAFSDAARNLQARRDATSRWNGSAVC